MTSYDRINDHVRAAFARRCGSLLDQYSRLRSLDAEHQGSEADYGVTLALAVVQALLTQFTEWHARLGSAGSPRYNQMALEADRFFENLRIENSFPNKSTAYEVLESVRDALSHPVATVSSLRADPFRATGYAPLDLPGTQMTTLIFTNSPWVSSGGLLNLYASTNRERLTRSVQTFEGKHRCKGFLEVRDNGPERRASIVRSDDAGGQPYVPYRTIEMSVEDIGELARFLVAVLGEGVATDDDTVRLGDVVA